MSCTQDKIYYFVKTTITMNSLKQYVIKKVSEKDNEAHFEIGPLPTGYGHTLGNFLRRVLLASVPGSSITSIKIDGVQHEYATLGGVGDDILTIILALKNVVLVAKTNDPITLEIDVKGKDGEVVEVTAGDIKKNSDVEIINPEYVITKLTSAKARFKAEIVVERGIGYAMPNEEIRKEVGMLPVDANFSPVELVHYSVVPTRVGNRTDLDQVNISIKTNGSVTAIEALHVAAEIINEMSSHLFFNTSQMITGNEISVLVGRPQDESVKTQSTDKEPIKVVDLNLTTRLTNALLRSGYDDLRKLEGLTEEEVANIRGMGSKSYTELLDIIKKYEIKLV